MSEISFDDLGLSAGLLEKLHLIGFKQPTEIQKHAIPAILGGRDVLASSNTGTGKTCAFVTPILSYLLESLTHQRFGIIITPTRELAKQISMFIHQLVSRQDSIKIAVLIGGEPIAKQLQSLRSTPDIVIGTPGRINDHVKRGSLDLSKFTYVVLDEADRMLDMGFGVQIDQIVKEMPPKHQFIMFSATIDPIIQKLAQKYLNDPQHIFLAHNKKIIVKQEFIDCNQKAKYSTLISQLKSRSGTVIIFVRTKRESQELSDKLCDDGYDSVAIHGDLPQRRREIAIKMLRDKKCSILVATDVASRGIDIDHVEHVINYDIPETHDDYIHRIGRAGRGKQEGFALSFVMPYNQARWKEIRKKVI